MKARILNQLEHKLVWRDATVLVATVLLASFCALAVLMGAVRAENWRQTQASMQLAERKELARYRELAWQADAGLVSPAAFRDPRHPGAYGRRMLSTRAAIDPLPSSLLSVGQGDLLPTYFKVNTGARDKAASAYELANPHRLQVGDFDFAFVLIWLFPLLAIAVGHSVATHEREMGLDRMLMLGSRSPTGLYLKRLTRRMLPLVAVLLVTECLAFLWALDAFPADWKLLQDLVTWWAITLAYAAFWWACVAAVIARAHTRRIALIDLTGLWLLFMLCVPLLATITAEWKDPMPSRPGYVMAMRDAAQAIAKDKAHSIRALVAQHPRLARMDAPIWDEPPEDIVRIAAAQQIDAWALQLTRPFDEARDAQDRWTQGWAWLSPAILLRSQIDRLTGSDLARHRDFVRQVDDYREQLRGFFAHEVLRQRPQDVAQFESNAAYPRFRYEPFQGGALGSNDMLLWTLLLGVTGTFVVASWRRQKNRG